MDIQPIATFQSPFSSKFGIPRQSGIVASLSGDIVFEPRYRTADALRGMEEFDYIWLIWGFSGNRHEVKSPIVRPPRLGGNVGVGVFASRSPFRPNALGLSSVRLDSIDWDTPNGPIIHVLGADLMDHTPIFDIKPYVAYADSHQNARSGFVDATQWPRLKVDLPPAERQVLAAAGWDERKISALEAVLAEDPRPHYQHSAERIYGMPFGGFDIRFKVENGYCKVVEVAETGSGATTPP